MTTVRRDAQGDLAIESHENPARADIFDIEVNERERTFTIEGFPADLDSNPVAVLSREDAEAVFVWLAEKLYGADFVREAMPHAP